MDLSLTIAFTGLGLLQIAIGVLFVRNQRAVERLNGRVGHLVAGVSLLTDTAESGFRDVAAEIGRTTRQEVSRPRPRAATERRLASAVRRGRTVQEIAAAEQLSEGEVKLRLELASSSPRRKKAADAATM